MAIEIQINNSADVKARYVGWTPAPCRIRLVPTAIPKVGPFPFPVPATVGVKLGNGGTVGKLRFYKTATSAGATTLALKLPASGAWVPFWMGGEFGQPSRTDGDAAVRVWVTRPKVIVRPVLTVKLMVRVRKDAEALTTAERDRFVKALATLNDAGAGPFAQFRDMHVSGIPSDEAHFDAGFLPWHRAYLLDLERELQKIDRSVSLPYWRFDKPAPKLFKSDFLGAPGTGLVVDLSPSNPLLLWTTDGVVGIQRSPNFAVGTGSPADLGVISEASTLGLGTGYAAFRDMEDNPHGQAHVASQGWIRSIGTAAKDPLFFLLHCNVDRLWAKWQWLNHRFDSGVAASYDSATPPATRRIGHNLPDTLWPWNGVTGGVRPPTAPGGGLAASPCVGAPGANPTVASQLDYQGSIAASQRLGFDYDDVPFDS